MKENTSPLMVTIRCCTYNHEPYIRQCLEGFVMQKTNFRFEAIVHDDASTDGTAAIIREYAKKYPDIIKPIFETENQYSKRDGSLRRIMDAHTHGKYVAICEGDDYWIDPLKLQKQVDLLEENGDVSIIYTGFKTVDSLGNIMQRPVYEKYKQKSFSGDILKELLHSGNFILTLTTCFRREVFESRIIKSAPINLDYLLFLVAASMGNAVYLQEETGCYRYVENSLMNSNISYVREIYMVGKKYFVEFLLSKKIEGYKLSKQVNLYMGLLEDAFAIYLNNKDVKYFNIIISKNKAKLLFPIVVIVYFLKKIKSFFLDKILNRN